MFILGIVLISFNGSIFFLAFSFDSLAPYFILSVVLFISILKSFIIILFCFVADFYSHATECNIIQREV